MASRVQACCVLNTSQVMQSRDEGCQETLTEDGFFVSDNCTMKQGVEVPCLSIQNVGEEAYEDRVTTE